MKFQYMENKLLEMEKARMNMFFENDFKDEEERADSDIDEYDSDDSQTQRAKQLLKIQRKKKEE